VSWAVALRALEPQRAAPIGGDHRSATLAERLRVLGVLDELENGKSVVHLR
jgi:hypothetical protein